MGKWQYYDSVGKPLLNTWYNDRSLGKTYYLQADGYMATGWIYYNNNYYYLDGSGARVTGWKQLGSKWYYLYESGIMASNTTVEGYKLGYDGAMV